MLADPAFGDGWLDDGWADVRLRRPTYPGDELTTTVTDGRLVTAKADGTVVPEGDVGRGRAPWYADLERPRSCRLGCADAVSDDRAGHTATKLGAWHA